MSIAWVKKNSKPLMSKYQCPVIENDFNDLMRNIMHVSFFNKLYKKKQLKTSINLERSRK